MIDLKLGCVIDGDIPIGNGSSNGVIPAIERSDLPECPLDNEYYFGSGGHSGMVWQRLAGFSACRAFLRCGRFCCYF
jgi:hypothetical protein